MKFKSIAEILVIRKYGFLGAIAIGVGAKIGTAVEKAKTEQDKRPKVKVKPIEQRIQAVNKPVTTPPPHWSDGVPMEDMVSDAQVKRDLKAKRNKEEKDGYVKHMHPGDHYSF